MKQNLIIKDYYGMLGIDTKAGLQEIKSAFRRAARLTHPDTTGDPLSYEKFILIREAYDVLSDSARRKEYDALLTAAGSQNLGPDEHFKRAFDGFGSPASIYRDEWEYFVRHPDDYLDLFDSIVRALAASALSTLAGLIITTLVFLIMFIILPITAASSLILLVLGSSGSPEPAVLVIIIAHLLYSRKNIVSLQMKHLVHFISQKIVSPLRGIPRSTGRWFIFFNYISAFFLLLLSGYRTILWLTAGETTVAILLPGFSTALSGLPVILFLSTALVLLFSIAVPLTYEVIREALLSYPAIRYSRFTVKSEAVIEYRKHPVITE